MKSDGLEEIREKSRRGRPKISYMDKVCVDRRNKSWRRDEVVVADGKMLKRVNNKNLKSQKLVNIELN